MLSTGGASTIPRTDAEREASPRPPLSRRRVLRAAVDLADREGLEALTMRGLAQQLGVEAMSLYHHVANKEALLDGVVDIILEEIIEAADAADVPEPDGDWRGTMRTRILAARGVLLRHRWAPRVLETRTVMSTMNIGWFEGLLGIFREAGFSYDLAHHALHALGSRALGFTQELFEPDDPEPDQMEATAMLDAMTEQFPHLAAMVAAAVHDQPDSTLGWCDDQTEFEFGLDLILDGLERLRTNV